jgi:hypothetical protein
MKSHFVRGAGRVLFNSHADLETPAGVSRGELYAALIQMVNNAEAISWNRFYNFLMGNSILVLAWATIYAAQERSILTSVVLSAICLLGAGSGMAWAALGKRSREYVEAYFKQALELEKDPKTWNEAGIADSWKPFTGTQSIRQKAGWFSTSAFVLTWTPRVFSLFYLLLLVASWSRLTISSDMAISYR